MRCTLTLPNNFYMAIIIALILYIPPPQQRGICGRHLPLAYWCGRAPSGHSWNVDRRVSTTSGSELMCSFPT